MKKEIKYWLIGWLICGGMVWLEGAPYLGYLYPAGAKRGTTVRVLAGGQGLWGIRSGVTGSPNVRVVRVTLVPGFPPPEWRQRKYLLEWLDRLEKGRTEKPEKPEDTVSWRKVKWWDELDKLDEYSRKLVYRDLHTKRNSLQETPSIRQLAMVDLEIDEEALPGEYSLRLYGSQGMTGPKLFVVGEAEEYLEREFTAPGKEKPAFPEIKALPATLNGQVMPGETDGFRVPLKKGLDYVFRLTGRRLEPFIGDAVPGYFQPVLRLLDAAGREVGFADDEYADPDPILRYRAKESGVYTLEVRDNLYRGRADFVYRVEVYPGVEKFKRGKNPFRGYPETSAMAAQVVPLEWEERGRVIRGELKNPGERAIFRIRGRRGTQMSAELKARRLGSPLDGKLTLRDPRGVVLAEADDAPRKWNVGEILQQTDPKLSVTLPEDGEYRLELSASDMQTGPDYYYYMYLGPARPDFEVYTGGSVLTAAYKGMAQVKVYIERTDGFTGEIRLIAEDAPYEKRNRIAPEKDTGMFFYRNEEKNWKNPPRRLRVYAEGKIKGKTVKKPVIACEEYTQAFAYSHLLPVNVLYVCNRAPGRPKVKAKAKAKETGKPSASVDKTMDKAK